MRQGAGGSRRKRDRCCRPPRIVSRRARLRDTSFKHSFDPFDRQRAHPTNAIVLDELFVKLSEVLLKLNETSLSQLRRDHGTGHLERKIANASKQRRDLNGKDVTFNAGFAEASVWQKSDSNPVVRVYGTSPTIKLRQHAWT